MSVNMFHFLFWSVHKRYFLTCTRYFVPPYFKAQNACLVHCQYMSSLYTRDFGPPYRRLSEDVRAQVPVVVVCFFLCFLPLDLPFSWRLETGLKYAVMGSGKSHWTCHFQSVSRQAETSSYGEWHVPLDLPLSKRVETG